jgi:F-type H+-transporting ATPase subunit b
MEILAQLGLDQTVWIQLVFFLISYLFLSKFLFAPYMRNLEFRKKNTGGSVEEASKTAADTERLVLDYQSKMKAQNESATVVYNKLKQEAQSEEEKLVTAARAKSSELVDQTKKKIATDIAVSRDNLRGQVPQLSGLIASRVLGRDLT